ncbi:hypothetical protein [Streptomyces cellulosae]|uniref:hypothetical protein n=1 Tax=Streptomyces cellulosae TaxID=1968 RepID=UPI0004C9D290|nr:hypothetical protein [Streptomyces cellulosae]
MKQLAHSKPDTITDTTTAVPSEAPTKAPPESNLTPLLTAWDLAHPAAADPDWRHLLDELAHPDTTRAFHRLAGAPA